MKEIYLEHLIYNLMKEESKIYLSIYRLRNLECFIFNALSKENKLKDYNLCTSSNKDSFIRQVQYNNWYLRLDIDGDICYLRENVNIQELVDKYKLDDYILNLIREFINKNVTYKQIV